MKFLIDKLFSEPSRSENSSLTAEELQLSTAALLIEVATIDQQFDPVELERVQQLIEKQFSLSHQETQALVDSAKTASREASSLYEFTQYINDHCDNDEKINLVKHLWEIAYADQTLDKYEEHIIRRIADLIHVRHIDFIRTKNAVRDSL